MNNVFRCLVFGEQVSLTVADTTAIVREGIERHRLSPASAQVFGKAISAMTFAAACLKMETGEISLSVKCDGECGDIGVSGNRNLFMRGYIANTEIFGDASDADKRCFGKGGSLTIIRDDGYNRPFVGACALVENGGVDEAFEEYYRISEQLPTYFKTTVCLDEKGNCIFAGVAVLQPLPFADKETLEKMRNIPLGDVLDTLQNGGMESCLSKFFQGESAAEQRREATYRCNCSRERLKGVLVSVGEAQLRQIIKEDGQVRVHCHYCNTDYNFTEEDADELFSRG